MARVGRDLKAHPNPPPWQGHLSPNQTAQASIHAYGTEVFTGDWEVPWALSTPGALLRL